jgi:hypothetical protein
MIPAKPLERAISNIKYRLGKYYVRMGLTPSPEVRVSRDFSKGSLPQDPYVINERPLRAPLTVFRKIGGETRLKRVLLQKDRSVPFTMRL